MAPLPQNLTNRLWLDYEIGVGGPQHTLMVRFNDALATTTQAMNAVESYFDFVAGSLNPGWKFLSARVAEAGSDFSLPVPLTAGLAGVLGTAGSPINPIIYPREVRHQGRSTTTGRRVSFSIYGTSPDTPPNYRWGPGEVAFTNNAIVSLLNGAATAGIFLAVDGTQPSWAPYVNVNFNSYWETRARVS